MKPNYAGCVRKARDINIHYTRMQKYISQTRCRILGDILRRSKLEYIMTTGTLEVKNGSGRRITCIKQACRDVLCKVIWRATENRCQWKKIIRMLHDQPPVLGK